MDDTKTVIRVPIPAGTVDLLDPEVIEREVRRGQELNRIQQERDGRATTPGQHEQRQCPTTPRIAAPQGPETQPQPKS